MRMLVLLCAIVSIALAGDSLKLRRVSLNGRLQDGGLVGQVRADVSYELKDGSPNVTTSYFTQKLDHFDSSNQATWQQFYWQNTAYYKAGGPIFILIGGEGPTSQDWIDDCAEISVITRFQGDELVAMNYHQGNEFITMETSHHLDRVQMTYLKFAKYYGAMAFQLEHRFYGRSHPTADMSTENLKYLTIQQALADLADFITAMNLKYGWAHPKWVTFGGSYSGALSAWFRLKYPQLAVGAVASSAPVFAKVDFQEYFGVVRDSLNAYKPECVKAVQESTDFVANYLKSPSGQSTIVQKLKLCANVDWTNTKNLQNFWSIIFGNFQGVFADTITIPNVCDAMTSATVTDPLDRFAAVNEMILKAFGQNCIDASYQNFINYMKQTGWSTASPENRLWVWQTCSEVGYFQDTDMPNLPFEDKIPISFYKDMCSDIFGSQFNSDFISKAVDATNAFYGGRNYNGTKVVLPNGSVDPWHALGLLSPPNDAAPTIYIQGTAHCSDMYPSRDQDKHELIVAREIIDLNLGYWLRTAQ